MRSSDTTCHLCEAPATLTPLTVDLTPEGQFRSIACADCGAFMVEQDRRAEERKSEHDQE